jgi:nucleoside-diphosphate-sugar epimerase
MKILLTGATGFIGQHLSYALKNTYSSSEIFKFGRNHNQQDIIQFQPNVIFHLAAEIKDQEKMFTSNVILTYDLLEASRHLKELKAFINVGSSSEYGRKTYPISETDFLNPTTIYEGTKGAVTLLCQSYARTYSLPIVTARPFTIYGPHEPSTKLIPTIYHKMMNNDPIELSKGMHDLVYISDFITGLIILSQQPREKICGDIVNFGSGQQISNQEIVHIFEHLLRKKAKIIPVNKIRSYDSDFWECNIRYAKEKYSWAAITGPTRGIKQYIQSES